MKYLIIKCESLADQYECDANRIPVCITEDKEKYWKLNYEIYSINDDGSFTLVKESDEAGDKGIAIYYWYDRTEDPMKDPPHILEKFPRDKRKTWGLKKVTKYAKKYNFKEKTEFIDSYQDIVREIKNCGCYGDVINGKYTCIGEYRDDRFSIDY